MTLTVAPLTSSVVTLSDYQALVGGGTAVEFSSSLAGLKVTPPSSGLSVIVKAGTAIANGLRFTLSVDTTLTVTANASSYSRIDAVVAWVDLVAQTSGLAVVAGTPSSSPTAPLTTLNAGDWSGYANRAGIALGYVTVPAGASTIASGNIADRRVVAPTWASAPVGLLGMSYSSSGITVPVAGHTTMSVIPNGSGGPVRVTIPYLPANRRLRISLVVQDVTFDPGDRWFLHLVDGSAALIKEAVFYYYSGFTGAMQWPEIVYPALSPAEGPFQVQVYAQRVSGSSSTALVLGAPVILSVTDIGRSVPTDWS